MTATIDQIEIAPDYSYIIESGHIYPITQLFDGNGNETIDGNSAVSGVAGKDGYWLTFDIFQDDILKAN